nr:hypothetical protein [Tanacetum cinerariifolium]
MAYFVVVNQLRTTSTLRNQATIQDGRVTVQQVQERQGQSYSGTSYKSNATSFRGNNASGQARVVKCYNCQGEGHMARQCTQPKRPRNATWYKDKAILAEAQEARQLLDEEQLTFLADLGVPNGQVVQTIIPNNAAFQTKDLDTYDSDCDDILNAKAVLMANISNYGFDIILEVPHSETYLNDMKNHSVHAMQDYEQTPVVDVYSNKIIMIDDEETLILEEESRLKMSKKEKDPEAIKQNISHKPIDYEKLNRLSNDFRKRFTRQQELSVEQDFWLRMSNPTSKTFDASPVKIESPKELPKVSLVNESLKKLKFHLARFDNMVKIMTTPDAHTEASNEELKEPMEDQPLPNDASPTALSPNYVVNSEDEKEDPADYPADRGNNDDDESSNDDDDD